MGRAGRDGAVGVAVAICFALCVWWAVVGTEMNNAYTANRHNRQGFATKECFVRTVVHVDPNCINVTVSNRAWPTETAVMQWQWPLTLNSTTCTYIEDYVPMQRLFCYADGTFNNVFAFKGHEPPIHGMGFWVAAIILIFLVILPISCCLCPWGRLALWMQEMEEALKEQGRRQRERGEQRDRQQRERVRQQRRDREHRERERVDRQRQREIQLRQQDIQHMARLRACREREWQRQRQINALTAPETREQLREWRWVPPPPPPPSPPPPFYALLPSPPPPYTNETRMVTVTVL